MNGKSRSSLILSLKNWLKPESGFFTKTGSVIGGNALIVELVLVIAQQVKQFYEGLFLLVFKVYIN